MRKTVLGFLAALPLAWSAGYAKAESVIADIVKTKVLKVCQAADAPWSFLNPKTGEWEGFNLDLVRKLADELGARLEVVDSGWAGLVPGLTTGKCHMSAAPMFATVERNKAIIFTRPFAAEAQLAIVKNGSGIRKFADLDKPGKVILSSAGSAITEFAQRFFKNATVKPQPKADTIQWLSEVAAGRVDALWASYISFSQVMQANPAIQVEYLDEQPVGYSPIRWAIPPGEYHFQQLVDNWLEHAIATGVAQDRWENWFKGVPYRISPQQ